MIVCIEGRRLDTEKAKHHWDLDYFDGSNHHIGDVYCSSRGTWYVYTMSQWGNGHRWELMSPEEILETCHRGLRADDIAEIIEVAGLETE